LGRKSDSRYRAVSQLAACSLERLTQGVALEDSRFALGYYRPPYSGLSVCGFADSWELSAGNWADWTEKETGW
jgi:hypothetical protein